MKTIQTNKRIEKDDGKESAVKIRNRAKLLDYLGDPENEWPNRQEYSTLILEYKSPNQIYRTLTPKELASIEVEAMDTRKARTIRQRANILSALFKRAIGFERKAVKYFKGSKDQIIAQEYFEYYPPNVSAASEFLDRTEGKVTEKHEHTGKDGGKIEVEHSSIDLEGAKAAFDGFKREEHKPQLETIKKAV